MTPFFQSIVQLVIVWEYWPDIP